LDRKIALTRARINSVYPPAASAPASQPMGPNAALAAIRDPEPATPRYADDPEWRRLNADLKHQKYDLERELLKKGERHPTIIELKKNVEFAKKELEEREQALNDQVASFAAPAAMGVGPNGTGTSAMTLDGLLRDQLLEKKQLDDDIKALRGELDKTYEIAKSAAANEEELARLRRKYDAAQQELDIHDAEDRASALGRISMVGRAYTPTQPDKDRRILLTVMALVGAASAGAAGAFVRASLTTNFHEVGDVTRTVRAPFLGAIPV